MRIASSLVVLFGSALVLTACEGLVDLIPSLTAHQPAPPLTPLPPPSAPTAYAARVVEIEDAGANVDSGKPTHVAQQLAALDRLEKDFTNPISFAASYSETGAIVTYEGSTKVLASGGGPIETSQKARIAGLEAATLSFGRVIQSEKDNVAVAEWQLHGTREKKPVTTVGASIFSFDDDGVVTKEDRFIASARLPSGAAVPLVARASKGTSGEDKILDLTSDLLAAFATGTDATLGALVGDDAILIDASQGKEVSGKREILAVAAAQRGKIADARHSLPVLLAAESESAAETLLVGTRKGNASAKLELHGLGIVEWAEGKAQRIWLFQQGLPAVSSSKGE